MMTTGLIFGMLRWLRLVEARAARAMVAVIGGSYFGSSHWWLAGVYTYVRICELGRRIFAARGSAPPAPTPTRG